MSSVAWALSGTPRRVAETDVGAPYGWKPFLASLLAVASIVALLSWGGIMLSQGTGRIAAIWLSNGFTIAILLCHPRRRWPAYLAVSFLANTIADAISGAGLLVTCLLAACNLLEVVLAAWLLTRPNGLLLGWSQQRHMLRFLLIAGFGSPACIAIIAALLLHGLTGAPFGLTALNWFLSDALGTSIIVPLALSVMRGDLREILRGPMRARTAVLLLGFTLVCAASFAQSRYSLRFIPSSALLFLAAELEFAGVTIGVTILTALAIGFTAYGTGPFTLEPALSLPERIFALQFFVLWTMTVATMVAAALADRRRTRDALLQEQERSAEREAVLRQSQKMEAIGRLTAGIAHDFNNLLQAQLGSLELLRDEVADRPRGRKFADIAISTAERGAQLTHYLLAFSRKQILKPKRVHLQGLLESIREVLPRLLGSRVTVRVAIEKNVPPAFADIAQVETALLNLALNARDAMPEGGELVIEAYASSAVPDAPPAAASGEYVVISVADSGCGMDPATLAQACEPFFTTKGMMGSGLGLSMVHGFARQSGGDLRLTSAPGRGTRAEIWLPIDESYSTETPSPAAGPTQIQGRRAGRVLLVDDAEDVLLTLSTFLQGAGYQVVSVRSGPAALEVLVQDGDFDVLVTDYAMPELDGMALLREMAALQPGLPALIVTGFADVALDEDLPAPVHLLRKPFCRDELMRALDALVRIRGAISAG